MLPFFETFSAKLATWFKYRIFVNFSLKDDKSTKHWLSLLLKNLDAMSGSQPSGPQTAPLQAGNGKPAVGKLPGGL